MRSRLSVLALAAALALAGCGSLLEGPPTPEPFTPPPSPTARTASATAVATPEAGTATPEATAVVQTTYTVQRGAVTEALELEGTVISAQRRPLAFAIAGTLKDLKLDGPGKVTKGQEIATLDTSDIDAQAADARTQYSVAQDAVNKATLTSSLPARKALIDLQTAQDALAAAKLPASPEEIATAKAALQRAQANAQKVRNDASAVKSRAELAFNDADATLKAAKAEQAAAAQGKDDARKAAANDAVAKAQKAYDQARIDYDTARGNEVALVQDADGQVAEAQAALDKILKLPDPVAVRKAERDVESAQLALDQARAQAGVDPTLQAKLDEAKKTLDDIEAQLAAHVLVAPADGEVAEIAAQPGATLQPGDAVVIFVDPSVPADSREVQIPSVDATVSLRVGQAVSVAFQRFPDKQVAGKVARIMGDPAGARSAYVDYSGDGLATDPGDVASIVIALSQRANVLWLPPKAIRNDGRSFVMVKDGDKLRRVDIDLGARSPERVEILRGLSEGQVVVGE